jgi:hypothetical protein
LVGENKGATLVRVISAFQGDGGVAFSAGAFYEKVMRDKMPEERI